MGATPSLYGKQQKYVAVEDFLTYLILPNDVSVSKSVMPVSVHDNLFVQIFPIVRIVRIVQIPAAKQNIPISQIPTMAQNR